MKKGGDVQKKAAGGPVQQGAATTQASRPGTTAAASTATTPRPGTTASSNPRGGPLDVVKNPSNLLTQANRVMSDQRARSQQLQARAQQARAQADAAKARAQPTKGPIPTRTPPTREPITPPTKKPIPTGITPTREPMPSRKVIGYRSPPPGMSSADLANFDTRMYEPMKRGGLAVMPKGKC